MGLVLVSSAIDFPNSISNELLYSNHQQMRNDGNTKKEMAKLLETNTYGTFLLPRSIKMMKFLYLFIILAIYACDHEESSYPDPPREDLENLK